MLSNRLFIIRTTPPRPLVHNTTIHSLLIECPILKSIKPQSICECWRYYTCWHLSFYLAVETIRASNWFTEDGSTQSRQNLHFFNVFVFVGTAIDNFPANHWSSWFSKVFDEKKTAERKKEISECLPSVAKQRPRRCPRKLESRLESEVNFAARRFTLRETNSREGREIYEVPREPYYQRGSSRISGLWRNTGVTDQSNIVQGDRDCGF